MEKLIKIKRSDGSIENVTSRELEALNEVKYTKWQLHGITRQRNKLAVLLTISWVLFTYFAFFYTMNDDSDISPASPIPKQAAKEIIYKENYAPAIAKSEDKKESQTLLNVNNDIKSIHESVQLVTEVKIEEEPETTQQMIIPGKSTFDKSEIIIAIKNWCKTWSNQDHPAYIAAYSKNYQPGKRYPSYEAWASYRKKKIESPEWIDISISDFKIFEPDHAGEIVAQFRQSYNSNTYQDITLKQLHLKYEDGHWLILKELSIQQLIN